MRTRRIPRWLVATLALSLAFMVTPTGTAHAADNPVPVPPNTGLTDNGTGVVSAADRDFVVEARRFHSRGLRRVVADHAPELLSAAQHRGRVLDDLVPGDDLESGKPVERHPKILIERSTIQG